MWIIKHKNLFFGLSALLIIASVVVFFKFGLNLATDFTGGTIMEVVYPDDRPSLEVVEAALAELTLGPITIQEVGEQAYLFRLRDITEEERGQLATTLSEVAGVGKTIEEKRFSSIGPALGQELARKGIIATIIVIIMILLYITLAFRKSSQPVQSWKYALISIAKLLHDLIIPVGIFAWLGQVQAIEADALFVAAVLTIMGLSVNDAIVAFDRIRENLKRRPHDPFAETVGRSLSETLTRSLNTSITVILVLVAIFLYGAESTKYFALLLCLGMIVVTYSSIFVAAPLLVVWDRAKK